MFTQQLEEAKRLREENLKNVSNEEIVQENVDEKQNEANIEENVQEQNANGQNEPQEVLVEGEVQKEITEAPKAEETTEVVDDFEERFNKRIEELEYVPKDKYEQDLSSRVELKNDLIKRLVELDESGVELNESFLTNYFEDLDRYKLEEPKDVLSLLIREKQSEGYTSEEARLIVENEFEDLFSEYSDPDSREFKVQRVKSQAQARKFLEKLKQNKEQLALSTEVSKSGSVEKYLEQEKAKLAQQQESLNKFLETTANNIVKDLSTIEYDVNGEKVAYEPTKENKKAIKDAVKGYTTFLDDNFIKDGKLDQKGLAEFFTLFYAKDEIFRTISNQSKSAGKKELVTKDLKNQNFEPKTVSTKTNNNNNMDKVPIGLRGFIQK
jgi:hypothetical protein